MRKITRIRGFLTVGACSALLLMGGCSKAPDALTLMNTANEEMQKLNSYEATMDLAFKVGIEDGESSLNMNLNGNVMMQKINDPFVAYSDATISIDSFGQKETVQSQSYQIEQDGKIATYINDGSGWSTSEEEGISAGTAQDTLGLFDYDVVKNLQPKVTGSKNINGNDCWEVTFSADFDQLMDIAGEEIDDTSRSMLSAFGSDIQLNCKLYVDKDSNRYTKASVEIMGLDTFFNMLAGFSDMPENTNITVDNLVIDFVFGSFNEIENIEAPQGIPTDII
ncbi:DUF6612 family protein [Merdibacter massiliensis]|uniref:DUF6612 family protein n=1 Tax=Merdibacter massiliensis TaxID=1871030 RepID=UPI00117B5D53|nr:DUF6612 family protein [Merdibacter massiliensis]